MRFTYVALLLGTKSSYRQVLHKYGYILYSVVGCVDCNMLLIINTYKMQSDAWSVGRLSETIESFLDTVHMYCRRKLFLFLELGYNIPSTYADLTDDILTIVYVCMTKKTKYDSISAISAYFHSSTCFSSHHSFTILNLEKVIRKTGKPFQFHT